MSFTRKIPSQTLGGKKRVYALFVSCLLSLNACIDTSNVGGSGNTIPGQEIFDILPPDFFAIDSNGQVTTERLTLIERNFESRELFFVNYRLSDGNGIDTDSVFGVCNTSLMSIASDITTTRLQAGFVDVLTPYSCQVNADDINGNGTSFTIRGNILPINVEQNPPNLVLDIPANIASGATISVPVTVIDESNTTLIVTSPCSVGNVQATIVGDNTASVVNVMLTAPQVVMDTPYSCQLIAEDEFLNRNDGAAITGTIIAPVTTPETLGLFSFSNECALLQSSTDCNHFGGDANFCEKSEPATSCNSNPVSVSVDDISDYLILRDEGRFPAVIDFSTFPAYSEDCRAYVTERLSTTPTASDTAIYECDAGAAGELVPPSVTGGGTVISTLGGAQSPRFAISTDEQGQATITPQLINDSDVAFGPGSDQIAIGAGGTTSDSVDVIITTPDGNDALYINDVSGGQGLESTLFVAEPYTEVWTFLFFHDPVENADPQNPVIRGLTHRQFTETGMTVTGGVTLPIISPELADFIADNNLGITEDIVVSARNTIDFPGVFAAAGGTGGNPPPPPPSGTPATPPQFGGGVAITIPSTNLTARQVCPIHNVSSAATRCQAGTNETLMVVNGASEIAKYDPINGAFNDFFRDDMVSNFPVTDGWEATQAPDNCVLYTDNAGAIYLYDEQGELITADGNGNTTGTDTALLLSSVNGALNYRGFDFYKPDSGSTWFLYVVEIANFDNNGFPETRSRIVRYDYSISGADVLTNRQVVFEEDFTHFIDLVIVDGLLNLVKSRNFIPFNSPEAFGSGSVKRFQINQDGSLTETASFGFDSSNPAQISASFDEGLLLADFGSERFRLYDEEDPTTFQSVRETYNLMQQGVFQGTGEIVGVFPLRNGNYLISGESIEIDRSVVERVSQEFNIEPDGRNSEGRLIGKACLP